jgi:DHA2 family multidrug resistance protein
VRLFGGTLGAVATGHFIAQQEKLHSNLLGLHVERGNWITDGSIRGLAAGLYSHSAGLAAATGRAVGITSGRIRLQAYTLSLIDGFLLVAWGCACALIIVALLRKSPLTYGDLSAIQQGLVASKESKS